MTETTTETTTTTDAQSERRKRALLLGMVYSCEHRPKRGQEFRDRVRCEALENKGYVVHTLDDKHSADKARENRHVQANFANPRRMLKSIKARWGEGEKMCFDTIVLDYFFSPSGWARNQWTDRFFRETLPAFAQSNVLTADGKLFLPRLPCVEESLEEFKKEIGKHYDISLLPLENILEHPLYAATEDVTKELMRCPDMLTNETQINPLIYLSDCPFYVLTNLESMATSTAAAEMSAELTTMATVLESDYNDDENDENLDAVTEDAIACATEMETNQEDEEDEEEQTEEEEQQQQPPQQPPQELPQVSCSEETIHENATTHESGNVREREQGEEFEEENGDDDDDDENKAKLRRLE